MTPVTSFAPLSRPDAQVLILGSMPGAASLRLQQYYGHPRNAFWKITGQILGFDPAGSYAQRTAALLERKVALWDVLAACVRAGSLDASIAADSMVPNDFVTFFARHPAVRRVCFNGAMAHSVFRKQVLPHVANGRPMAYVQLPSTSPAHAGMAVAAKLDRWRVIAPGAGSDAHPA